MTFSLHESIQPDAAFDYPEIVSGGPSEEEATSDEFYILREKLQVPAVDGILRRPRLDTLLAISMERFPATLICGRAGTGKTAIAAKFAAKQKNTFWYSVESTDSEWPAFSRYFSAALSGCHFGKHQEIDMRDGNEPVAQREIARFLVNRFSNAYAGTTQGPALIVLDDIHHLFDAPWFDDFFNLLLYSLPPDTHLLLICRTKPPGPLWRLRSKQMLNVLDEKNIAFNACETEALYDTLGLDPFAAKEAQKHCFGRISKLLQYATENTATSPAALL